MLAAPSTGTHIRRMTRLVSRVALVLAMLVISIQAPAQQAAGAHPTLVVLITIDQMRGDYLTRFGPQLTGGLGRLSRGGAWYTNAHHDHAITETAPGHATLLAGRFPRSTGIMANRIGVDDEAAPLIANGVGPGASPKRFVGTTLSDWLTASDSRSRTFSVSTKDRGAILPLGKSKSQVYWYSPDGRFVTSSYYRDALPPWVQAFNDRHFPQTFAGRSWDLLLPDSAYHEPDSVAVEGGGTGFVFPHILPDDPIDAASIVRGTPFIDDITLAFALHGVQSLSLGAAQQTDLLAISLSGTDFIGHRYGPDSREIHDQIVRVDRALGVFLDSLYRLRDSSRVTVVLTGDHGAGTIPELAAATTKPTPTRVTLYPLLPALRARLNKAGVDTNAFDIDQQVVLIDRKAFERAKVNADSVLTAFAEEVRQLPGVARVDRFKALLADTLSDPIARRWSHQFPPNSQIELVVTLTPFSLWRGNIASHGSPYDYDSNVPLVFYGAGVQPGKHAEFVRTVDLAPTLAEIAGVRPLETLDGVVLRNALR
jgi:predicted AlkP superfamily pyrophosphatase or phosphodiesterase